MIPPTKDYSRCCQICLIPDEEIEGDHHCSFTVQGGNHFIGCHETFGSEEAFSRHLHPKTGGCSNPSDYPIFKREGVTWKLALKSRDDTDQSHN